MRLSRLSTLLLALGLAVGATACGSRTPAAPSSSASGPQVQLVSPANGARLDGATQPVSLVVRTLPLVVGTLTFEVSTDATFARPLVSKSVAVSTGGQTTLLLDPLPSSTDYFWRARLSAGDLGVSTTSRFTIAPGDCAITITSMHVVRTDADFGGPGTVCVDGGTILFSGPVLGSRVSLATSRPFILGPGGATFTAGVTGVEVALSGPIGGPGGLTVEAGSLTMTGLNTYTGDTRTSCPSAAHVACGRVDVASDASLGGPSSNVVLENGWLKVLGGGQSSRAITVTGNASVQSGALASSGVPLTLSGEIRGTGRLSLYGTIELTRSNSYKGGSHVSQRVAIRDFSALGTGPLSLYGRVQVAVATTSDLPLAIGYGGGEGAVIDTAGHDVVWNGDVSGHLDGGQVAVKMTKDGAGTLTLTANNSFRGSRFIVTGGALAVGDNANLGQPNVAVTLDGGTLKLLRGVTLPRAITLGANGGAIDTGAADVTVSGAVTGTGSLTKVGTGTLRLTGPTPFTGPVIILGGTVVR